MSPKGAPSPIVHTRRQRLLVLAARVGGLLALVFLQAIWERQSLPLAVRLFHAALVGLAIWRPSAALLVLAGLGPLAGDVWGLLGGRSRETTGLVASAPGGARLLEQMVLTVLTGWLARWHRGSARSRLPVPSFMLAIVALASAAAVLPARLFALAPDTATLGFIAQFCSGTDLTTLPAWRPAFFALYAIEGVTIACMVERVVRETPLSVLRLLSLALAAEAAAATLTIIAAVREAMVNPEWLSALPAFLARERMSRYTDANATASIFLLVGLGGIALLRRPVPRLTWVSAALMLVLAGLWVSGSRTALVSLVLIVLAVLGILVSSSPAGARLKRAAVLGATIGVVIITVATMLFYPGKRSTDVPFTVASRLVVTQAALRMGASSPVFGVGIGTFWDRSADFGTSVMPELARVHGVWWPETHENAHNNFLQVLAEQGVVGLVAFCAVLAAVLSPCWRLRATLPSEQRWILVGIFGFMLTWLTGHPLLVPEASFVFWLFFGIAAGLLPPAERPWTTPWVWLAAAMLVSVPIRVTQDMKVADLSHVGVGLSSWQHDPDRTAFRVAGPTFSLYVPANNFVEVPVRRAPGAPEMVHVEFRVDGQLVNSTTLAGDSWRPLTLRVPSKRRRFIRVDFTVTDLASRPLAAPCLHVGQDEAR